MRVPHINLGKGIAATACRLLSCKRSGKLAADQPGHHSLAGTAAVLGHQGDRKSCSSAPGILLPQQ